MCSCKKIKVGSTYLHYKGDTYTVCAIATMEDTGKYLVIYKDSWADKFWAMAADNFMSKVMLDNQLLDHFTLLDD